MFVIKKLKFASYCLIFGFASVAYSMDNDTPGKAGQRDRNYFQQKWNKFENACMRRGCQLDEVVVPCCLGCVVCCASAPSVYSVLTYISIDERASYNNNRVNARP